MLSSGAPADGGEASEGQDSVEEVSLPPPWAGLLQILHSLYLHSFGSYPVQSWEGAQTLFLKKDLSLHLQANPGTPLPFPGVDECGLWAPNYTRLHSQILTNKRPQKFITLLPSAAGGHRGESDGGSVGVPGGSAHGTCSGDCGSQCGGGL